MSTLLKSLLALAVALPLGAFVTGTLVAVGEEPPPRDPVIIEENTTPRTDLPTRRSEPTSTPSRSDDHGDDAEDEDDDIDVVTPTPGEVDDDDDHNRGEGGGDDDNRGPGGGDDDNSGPGGGDDD